MVILKMNILKKLFMEEQIDYILNYVMTIVRLVWNMEL